MAETNTRPSDRLKKYDRVITVKVSIGLIPLYKFIEKFLKIDDDKGNQISFILNEEQVEAYESMCLQRLEERPVRQNNLKARQLGFSTFYSAVIFVMCLCNAGRRGVVVADTTEHARGLFAKYKYYYENLPIEIKNALPKVTSNVNELVIEHPNGQTSSIRVTAQGESSGRSGTYQYLHLSECAFWQNLEDSLTAILPAVSMTNIDSMIFFETTANGVNDYKVRWDNDYAGKTPYTPLFFAWWKCSRYVVEDRFIPNYQKPNWLLDMQEKYNLTENQCAWYWLKYLENNANLEKTRQEYPSSPIEAFITTGNSVFNMELLLRRKVELLEQKPLKVGFYQYKSTTSLDGRRIQVTNIEWVEARNGSVKIFKEAIDGHPYVVCNDNAVGGEDYFATQVFDNYTGEQVATYHRNKCDVDDCAYQTYILAQYYNNAMLTGETNTNSYLLELCQKMGHKFIYQDQDVEDLTGRWQNRLGYKTKQNNRNYMIGAFAMAFRDNYKIINDYETICEMENFQVVSKVVNGVVKEKAQATGGAHDDLVMAACGFYLCRHAQSVLLNPSFTNNHKLTLEELEDRVDRNNDRLDKMKQERYRSAITVWD